MRIKIMSFIFILLISLSVCTPVIAANTNASTLQGKTYKLLTNFMDQYKGSKFLKVVSFGDKVIYRKALTDVQIVIVKDSTPNYNPDNKTITLPVDPGSIKDKDAAISLGETIWHELSHAIEDSRGDIGYCDSKEYAERNTEFMTHIVDNCLYTLRLMEQKAKTGASNEQLNNYWKKFLKDYDTALNLPETKLYPPDYEKLEKWFGFKANVEDIKKYYSSGAAGKSLKVFFTSISSDNNVVDMSYAGGLYTGEVVKGSFTINGVKYDKIPHGKGTLVFPSGMKLSGTWEYGLYISAH